MHGVLQGPEPFKMIFGRRSAFTRDCFRFIGLWLVKLCNDGRNNIAYTHYEAKIAKS